MPPHRQQGFLDLARERHFVGQKKVLRDLLGDRGRALRTTIGTIILRVENRGTRHAGKVDAAVLVEVLVLGRQEHVGSGGEQETHEPHQKAHYRSSVSTIAVISRHYPQRKNCRGTICQSTQAHNTLAVSVVRSIPK